MHMHLYMASDLPLHMHLYMASDLHCTCTYTWRPISIAHAPVHVVRSPLHMHVYMASDLRCQEGVHPLWLVVHVHCLLERAKKGYTLVNSRLTLGDISVGVQPTLSALQVLLSRARHH